MSIISVQHMSRQQFLVFNVNNKSDLKSYAFISIYDSDMNPPSFNQSNWHSGIFAQYDDSGAWNSTYLFSVTLAKKVLAFLNEIYNLPEPIKIIAHCNAGISRSVAVAVFINEILKLKIPRYEKMSGYDLTTFDTLVEECHNPDKKYFQKTLDI
jgi:hypothetical protein